MTAEPTIYEPQLLHPEQLSGKHAWERAEGEPARWFMRFRNYLNMGERRSINAVYEAEKQEKATKSRGKAGETWYNAARRYQWQARAELWDRAQDERRSLIMRKIATRCAFVSRPFRIVQLNTLAESLMRTLEQGLEPILYIPLAKQLQAVMTDICEEIAAWDVAIDASCDAAALDALERKGKRIEVLEQERELDLEADIDRKLALMEQRRAYIEKQRKMLAELSREGL